MPPSLSSVVRPAWHCLESDWCAMPEVVQQGIPPSILPPLWRLLLLSDGSLTRHLQLLTGEPTVVEVIDMSPIGHDLDDAPSPVSLVPGPRLRRQVWLRTTAGQCLAYAVSWWPAEAVDDYLPNRQLPIWASLSQLRTELYRDIQGLCYGHCPALEPTFGRPGPYWARHYLFWHGGRPLTLIYEVFSPLLETYLGPLPPAGPTPPSTATPP